MYSEGGKIIFCMVIRSFLKSKFTYYEHLNYLKEFHAFGEECTKDAIKKFKTILYKEL